MIAWGLSLTTGPAIEPVSLAEAKSHLNVDHGDDNDDITALIVAAREHVESFCRRQLISATWAYTLDSFPLVIYPPLPPLQSVTSIAYTDTTGAAQTLAASVYDAYTDREPGEVREAYGQAWPATRYTPEAVTVTYIAGYGDAGTDVPEPIRAAMKLIIGELYERREEAIVGAIIARVIMSTERLLWPYRMLEV